MEDEAGSDLILKYSLRLRGYSVLFCSSSNLASICFYLYLVLFGLNKHGFITTMTCFKQVIFKVEFQLIIIRINHSFDFRQFE